jgi:hypothetical protein
MTSVLVLAKGGREFVSTFVDLCRPMDSKVDTQKPLILLRTQPVCLPCPPINHIIYMTANTTVDTEKRHKTVLRSTSSTRGLFFNILNDLNVSTYAPKVDKGRQRSTVLGVTHD